MIYDPVNVRISLSNKCQVWKGEGGRGGSPTVFTFISIMSWGYIGCFKFLFFISQARTERTERVKPSLALAWDKWISTKIFLDQLNRSWFPERSANFYSRCCQERVIEHSTLLVSRHHNILVSTWFAFDAAVLGFDFSNNQLRFADVQGIRLSFNLNILLSWCLDITIF